jgi:hypothetical protein
MGLVAVGSCGSSKFAVFPTKLSEIWDTRDKQTAGPEFSEEPYLCFMWPASRILVAGRAKPESCEISWNLPVGD